MVEQIITYILIFITGIVFAHRNAHLKVFEQFLYKLATESRISLENKSSNFYFRFENCYYTVVHGINKKDLGIIKTNLRLMKHLVEEFLGETK